jgi:hypothetical protein
MVATTLVGYLAKVQIRKLLFNFCYKKTAPEGAVLSTNIL